MWVPETEAEIEQAIAAGTVEETSAFDAKRELPPTGRNKDLARNVCAMTVDGGVLLFGLGGDDPTRPDELHPFALAGAAERIAQVAETGIAEPPTIDVPSIESAQAEGLGYLVVVVPPSPRAPHMVILDGDNRYYGRGATGNRRLTQGEVERLYARRERWEVDRGELLDAAIAACPFVPTAEDAIATLTAIAHPRAADVDVAARFIAAAADPARPLTAVRELAAERDPFPGQGDASLCDATRHVRPGADAWAIEDPREPTSRYQVRFELRADGDMRFWQRPLANEARGMFNLMERSVTRAVTQLVEAAVEVYRRVGYVGAVDVGVSLADIATARGASLIAVHEPGPEYGAPEYRRTDTATMLELRRDATPLIRRLVEPLCDVISVRGYDIFEGGRGAPGG